jgi:hypothetical protein
VLCILCSIRGELGSTYNLLLCMILEIKESNGSGLLIGCGEQGLVVVLCCCLRLGESRLGS